MAIDKNSKAYQSLLNSGYTDEQINQMHDEVAAGQSAQSVINWQPPKAENVNPSTYDGTDGNGNVTVWPQNANLNYNPYWDDSNPNQQNQRGWLNEKYTWEGVSNTYIDYNPDLRLGDLDPNYLYWEAARQQNRKEAGYIARRNDQIASALYNEWLVGREDIANWLWQQKEWMNSTEEDRLNTIESIWKRLGQIKPEWEQPDPSRADEILTEDNGKLYGKVTADEWETSEWIDTLADANSVFRAMQESRVANLKAFINYNPADIAELMLSGTSPFWDQTLRDVQQYYPEFMAEVNAEKKKKLWQQNINAIASWWEMTTETEGQSNINNNVNSFATSNATGTKSSVEITKDVNNAMAESQTANEASETMASIEEDMAILKNRMKNLRQEANAAFKWDVPDYIVNAYINNKAQEIQNQMSILEDRYNAAYQRYTTELQQKQWQMEYDLKKQQLQIQKDTFELQKWSTEQWVAIDWYKAMWGNNKWTTNPWDTYEVTTMSDAEVAAAVDQLRNMYDNWQLGNAQCAAWIQKYYLPLLWISLPNLSSIENKKKLINEEKGYTPKRWDLIILNSKSAPANWHIWIVLNVREDGYIEYMDWNWSIWADWKWTEKVAINSINSESAKILWFRNVNKNQWGASWVSGVSLGQQWTDFDYTNFENFMKSTSQSEKETLAAQYGTDVYWMTQIARDALTNRAAEIWNWWEDAVLSKTAYNLLELFAKLYNSTADKNTWKLDFSFWSFWTTYPYDIRDQIKSEMTLEKMVEARANEIWFWQVTEWEWAMLRNAATAMWSAWWTRDSNVNKEVEWILQALWHAAYWEDSNISSDAWLNFRNNYKAKTSWNSSTSERMQDEASSWLSSWEGSDSNPWTWSGTNYVNQYWIIG